MPPKSKCGPGRPPKIIKRGPGRPPKVLKKGPGRPPKTKPIQDDIPEIIKKKRLKVEVPEFVSVPVTLRLMANLIRIRRFLIAHRILCHNKTIGMIRYYVHDFEKIAGKKYETQEEKDADKKRFSTMLSELYKDDRPSWKGYEKVREGVASSTAYIKSILDFVDEGKYEKITDKMFEEYAKQLPVYQNWVKDIRGFGVTSFGNIVAWGGDLTRFKSDDAMFKFFGLGVFDGHAQGKNNGKYIDGDAAIGQGYRRELQSAMIQAATWMVMAKNPVYGKMYDLKKKDYETKNDLLPKENQSKPRVIDLRAKRWLAKKILADLRSAWLACNDGKKMPACDHARFFSDNKEKAA